MAASLGELLDAKELEEAASALDADAGRVSFAAFSRWWTDEARVTAPKSAATLRVLRAKLVAKFLGEGMPHLVRRLADGGAAAASSEMLTHEYSVRIGDAAAGDEPHEGGASVDARLEFLPPGSAPVAGAPSFPGCGAVASVQLRPASGQDAAARAASAARLAELVRSKGLQAEASAASDGGATLLHVGVEAPDPAASAAELGVSLADFVEECSVSFAVKEPVTRLLDPAAGLTGTLASNVQGRLRACLRVRKALVTALAPAEAGHGRAAGGASLLEHTHARVALGNFEKLCEATVSRGSADEESEMRAALDAQLEQMRDALGPAELEAFQEVHRNVLAAELARHNGPAALQPEFWLETDFQHGLARAWRETVGAAFSSQSDEAGALLWNLLREDFGELESVRVHSPSGVCLNVRCRNIFDFSVLPRLALDEASGRWTVASG